MKTNNIRKLVRTNYLTNVYKNQSWFISNIYKNRGWLLIYFCFLCAQKKKYSQRIFYSWSGNLVGEIGNNPFFFKALLPLKNQNKIYLLGKTLLSFLDLPASVAQLDACPTGDKDKGFTPAGSATFFHGD